MSDVTRILYETAANSPAERHAARLAAASWCHRHDEPAETLSELLNELGIDV